MKYLRSNLFCRRELFVQSNRGYAALLSVVIVSSILLLVVTITSLAGFYMRYNIADSESKEQSLSLADACVDVAMLRLANNSAYAGNEAVGTGTGQCFIGPISTLGTQKQFRVKAVVRSAYSAESISLRTSDLSILAWQEIPNYF